MSSAGTVIHHLLLNWTITILPYKKSSRNDNKNKPKNWTVEKSQKKIMKLNGQSHQSKHTKNQEQIFELTKTIQTFYQWVWITWWQRWKQKRGSWKNIFIESVILNSLKHIAINNFFLQKASVIRPEEATVNYHCCVYVLQQRRKRQKYWKSPLNTAREQCLSTKALPIQEKQLIYSDAPDMILPSLLYFKWTPR